MKQRGNETILRNKIQKNRLFNRLQYIEFILFLSNSLFATDEVELKYEVRETFYFPDDRSEWNNTDIITNKEAINNNVIIEVNDSNHTNKINSSQKIVKNDLIENNQTKKYNLFGDKNITKYSSFYINIKVEKTQMLFYGVSEDGNKTLIKKYRVSTAKKNTAYPRGEGLAYKIELNPWWYPTPMTRASFKARGIELPLKVQPGNPNNFMGEFKIYLTHNLAPFGEVYRIHGTLSSKTIGSRETGGCVRMNNKEGKDLATKLKDELNSGKKIVVNFE
jgi:lipoprotein-anchoring transpeptidase ErfK/SrfK